jgi:hypothetical protein
LEPAFLTAGLDGRAAFELTGAAFFFPGAGLGDGTFAAFFAVALTGDFAAAFVAGLGDGFTTTFAGTFLGKDGFFEADFA